MANVFKVHSDGETNKNSSILFHIPSNQSHLFLSHMFIKEAFSYVY